jgi:branched-chain amino acid transport system ATP-binding protein
MSRKEELGDDVTGGSPPGKVARRNPLLHHLPLLAFVAVMAVSPLLLPEFSVTLLNYIGLYAIVAVGLVLADRGRWPDFLRPGGLCRPRRLHHGLADHRAWRLTLADAVHRHGADRRRRAVRSASSRCAWAATTCRWVPSPGASACISCSAIVEFLGGHTGITGIPAVSLFGWELKSGREFFYLIWLVVLLAIVSIRNLLDSRVGRAIRALKGGTVMAEAMGVNTAREKIIIFLIAALLASVSGWLYAHLQRFVNPTPFALNQGIEYLFMAVVGGIGHVWGAVLGAGVITILKQWLQDWLPQSARPERQFRDHRFRPGHGRWCCRSARAGLWPLILLKLLPVAGRGARACRTAEPLPRRQPTASRLAACSKASAVTKRFGGLVANNNMSLSREGGRGDGADRPERCRQEHHVQLHLGGQSGHRRQDRLPRANRRSRTRFARDIARQRHEPDLPARAPARQHDACWRTSPSAPICAAARGYCRAALRLDRAEENRLLAEAARQIERVGLAEHMFEPAGSLALGQQRIVEIARALCLRPLPAAPRRTGRRPALQGKAGAGRAARPSCAAKAWAFCWSNTTWISSWSWPTASSSWNLARRLPKACRQKSSATPKCSKPTSAAWSKS